MAQYKCCLCDRTEEGFGNNPFPMCDVEDYKSRCCDSCNSDIVVPMRFIVSDCDSPEKAREKVKSLVHQHNKDKMKIVMKRLNNKRRRLQ